MEVERRNGLRRKDDARTMHLYRRWAPKVAVAYLILLTAFAVATFAQEQQTSKLAHHLDQSNLRICHRLNLLRAGDNVSHFVEWSILSGYPKLRVLANRLTWIPLTHSCRYAVDHASTFRAPNPVYFWQYTPPNSELAVHAGE